MTGVLIIDDQRKRGLNDGEFEGALESLRQRLELEAKVVAKIEDGYVNGKQIREPTALAKHVFNRIMNEGDGFQGLVVDLLWPPNQSDFGALLLEHLIHELGCKIDPKDIFILSQIVTNEQRQDFNTRFTIPIENVLRKLDHNSRSIIVEHFKSPK
jgi:hypothetical protein